MTNKLLNAVHDWTEKDEARQQYIRLQIESAVRKMTATEPKPKWYAGIVKLLFTQVPLSHK